MTTWRRYLFTEFMVHVVPAELEADLLADLLARGAELRELPEGTDNPATITEWGFDRGGSCHLGEPRETVVLDGLEISVPCRQVSEIYESLRRAMAKPRRFASGARYVKLKLWVHATVLAPGQASHLLAALADLIAPATERSDLFLAALDRELAQGGAS